MIPHAKMQAYVDRINEELPVHALWNGYHIRMFKRKNLVIGGSQDWTYYHNIDLIFKKVIFFNLPPSWSDTCVGGENLFRLSSREEFRKHHPDFDPQDRHIFAIDLHLDSQAEAPVDTYFILASNVFFEILETGDGMIDYEDDMDYRCKDNRVIQT